MPHFQWSDIPREQLSEKVARQVLNGEHMTVAKIYLDRGAVVPRHSHHHEQITLLEEGRVKFIFEDSELVARPGQVVQIPPHAVHSVEALEPSVALDVFSPVREDWIRGQDAYLRASKPV